MACHYCALWKEKKNEKVSVKKLIQNNHFFTIYPDTDYYHITGGEPCIEEDIIDLITFLKKNNKKIVLWTNGFYTHELLVQLSKWIDQVVMFIPATEKKMYHFITGFDGWEQVKKQCEYLKEEKIPLMISVPVHPMTIHFLPEAYEFAYELKIRLLIHYDQKEPFSKESIQYIKRLRNCAGVTVIKIKNKQKDQCYSVVGPELFTLKVGAMSLWQQVRDKAKRKWGI